MKNRKQHFCKIFGRSKLLIGRENGSQKGNTRQEFASQISLLDRVGGQERFYNPLWLFRAQLGFRIQVRAKCSKSKVWKQLRNLWTPSKGFLDSFQTPSRHLPETFQTPSRYLPDIFKTSSRQHLDSL